MPRSHFSSFIARAFLWTSVSMITCGATAHAATSQQICFKSRYRAAAKYANCHNKTLGLVEGGAIAYGDAMQSALSKCRVKYAKAPSKWPTKYPGTTCTDPRFVDNGDGTVSDSLTGLQWEQKTDDGSIHDFDDLYKWSAGGPNDFEAQGTAFTVFLETLNTTPCFAGHCDWRLPTMAELATIIVDAYPCTTCINESVFGPNKAARYATSTTEASSSESVGDLTNVWEVQLDIGFWVATHKGSNVFVRAVRGGL